MQNVIKSINVCPLGEKSVFRVSLPSSADRPRTVSQTLCQVYWLFSSSLRLHTLPSSFTPVGVIPPSKHPECNWSRFLAAVPLGPASLRPSHCSAAFLPCARRAGSNARAPAQLRSCLPAVTTPLCGQGATSAVKNVPTPTQTHNLTYPCSDFKFRGCGEQSVKVLRVSASRKDLHSKMILKKKVLKCCS